ncbi:MAG: ImmA/IrrE family metallo-endopeptidase [Ignavibacteria bacterium]|nr:ImmA/IrrE family metallo-endopeptidase [Ignavibacteria bacterium]
MNRPKKRTELCVSTAQKFLEAYESHKGALVPPIPVVDLASWLGFQVVYLSLVEDDFSALVSTREKLIGINSRHHRRRQRFSICHELAHILLHHPPESRCSVREIEVYNAEADECAAEILMPTRLIKRWLEQTQNPFELARVFDVSEQAMTRKLISLGFFGGLVRDTLVGWDVLGNET